MKEELQELDKINSTESEEKAEEESVNENAVMYQEVKEVG